MDEKMHVAVIGGGAAGLAAAVSAARAGARVTVLEAGARVGQKILKTGNGRCNITNAQVLPTDYRDPQLVAPLLEAYPASRVLDFFEELGLLTIEEDEGRVYPLSNTATSVLDVLRNSCARHGVELLCDHEVSAIRALDGRFELACTNGGAYEAEHIVVATGGGTSLLAGMGHAIAPFSPVLCPLKTETHALKGLSGVRVRAKLSAYDDADAPEPFSWLVGEILFRDYGLSGIVVFDMSREVTVGNCLGIDFVPQVTVEQWEGWLAARLEGMRACADGNGADAPSFAELMCGVFHSRVNDAIVRMAGYRPSETARMDAIASIAAASKDFRVQVTGFGDATQAQVTRGGALLEEFDALTLESSLHPGLFAAGETLDVDGRCGGFNLHWAWASGIATGIAAAR